jgi:hypothetical protein
LLVLEKPGDSNRAVYRFDLSAIPSNAFIVSATATFYVTQTNTKSVKVHRITDSWSETGVTWSTTANDYEANPETWFTPNKTGFAVANLTSLVQRWINGQVANNGIMLISSSNYNESRYTSREYGEVTKHPSLTVEYIPVPNTDFPTLVKANVLHNQNITGAGVTVAVVDTGYWSPPPWRKLRTVKTACWRNTMRSLTKPLV